MQFADEIAGQARRNGAGTAAFALFWSLIVGDVCVVVVAGTARQVASAYRPTADGIITVSETEIGVGIVFRSHR